MDCKKCGQYGSEAVCGKDGKTWGNACYAQCWGGGVAYYGKCGDNPYGGSDKCNRCKDYGQYPTCGKDGKNWNNACYAECWGGGVAHSGLCGDNDMGCYHCDQWGSHPTCGKDGKTWGNKCYAGCWGGGIKHDGPCKDGGGGGGGGGGPSGPNREPQFPEYYSYLKELPNQIDALYNEIENLNVKELGVLRGWYDQIVPEAKQAYLDQVQYVKNQLQTMTPMMGEAANVISGLLSGKLIDPVVEDSIKRAVGLTGATATAQGAPVKGSTYLTQAATQAATEAAAPIRLGGMMEGVNLLGNYQGMVGNQAQLAFLPSQLGLTTMDMATQAHKGLLDAQTWPMNWRLGAQQAASNLMGGAIDQVMAPWQLGINVGNMWSPYAYSQSQSQKDNKYKMM